MEQNKYTCPHCGMAINPASMLAKQSLKTRDTSPEAIMKKPVYFNIRQGIVEVEVEGGSFGRKHVLIYNQEDNEFKFIT